MRERYRLVLTSVLLTLVGVWLVGEVVTRSFHPYWDLGMALQYSSSLYAKHIISRQEHVVHKRSDPGDTLYINRWGYRGEGPNDLKIDDGIRVMIYGGSQVFSAGTGEDGWPDRVEKELASKGYPQVEVINAGTPGHASYDSVGKLFSYGHMFDPDYVLLMNAWNDLKYFHLEEPPLSRLQPYDPARNPRRNYLNLVDRWLGQSSQFYLMLRTKYFSWGLNPRRNRNFYVPDRSSKLSKTALKQYRLNVETFINVARSIGARPVIIKQPRLLTGDIPEKLRDRVRFENQNLTPEATLKGFQKTDEILESISSEYGVKLIDVSTMNGNGAFFYDHVHLTPIGAKHLSERVAKKLSGYFEED